MRIMGILGLDLAYLSVKLSLHFVSSVAQGAAERGLITDLRTEQLSVT